MKQIISDMSTLAIDYGRKKLGLAISFDGKVAHQFGLVDFQSMPQVANRLKVIVADNQVERIVLGLPVGDQGEVGQSALEVKQFGTNLEKKLKTPILYENETLSSLQAQERMRAMRVARRKRSQKEHAFAAQIILEDFLRLKC